MLDFFGTTETISSTRTLRLMREVDDVGVYTTEIKEAPSCEAINQKLKMKLEKLEKQKATDVYMKSPKVVGASIFGLSTICFVSLSIFASIAGATAFSKALLIPVIPSAMGMMILVPLLYKGY